MLVCSQAGRYKLFVDPTFGECNVHETNHDARVLMYWTTFHKSHISLDGCCYLMSSMCQQVVDCRWVTCVRYIVGILVCMCLGAVIVFLGV